jgi:alpha-2-macroglobulin
MRRLAIAAFVLPAVILIGCATPPAAPDAPPPEPVARSVEIPPLHLVPAPVPVDEDLDPAFRFRLREAMTVGEPHTRPSPATVATPLPSAEAQRLLARLSPLPDAARPEVHLPPESPPPPRSRATIESPFPPAPEGASPGRPTPEAAPLEVVRIAPEGEVGDARYVTIVFNQPMVPLTGVAEADREALPVRLEPEPPGRWRWLDVRTLRFEPEAHLPGATHFRLGVPVGVRALSGAILDRPVRHAFATPAVVATGGYPHGQTTGLDPLFLLVFDQRIDPDQVAAGSMIFTRDDRFPVRLASAPEIEADTVLRRQVEAAPEGRHVVLAPTGALPAGAEARLMVGRNVASLEGPRVTGRIQYLPFRTAGPLTLDNHQCGDLRHSCRPGDRWYLAFSNALNPEAWSDDLIQVSPEVEGLSIYRTPSGLTLLGATRAHTSYTIRLDPAIRDIFGQELGQEEVIRIRVEDAEPHLAIAGAPFVVLDPAGGTGLRVQTRHIDRFRVRLYAVGPDDWGAYREALRQRRGRGDPEPLAPPGALAASFMVDAEGAGFGETVVDLSPALTGEVGQVFVVLDPAGDGVDGMDPVHAWVQATRLGIVASVGPDEVMARITSLETGEPLPGVSVRLGSAGGEAVTDAEGYATIPLPEEPVDVLTARRAGDLALLAPTHRGFPLPAWQRRDLDRLRWEVFTDRGLYRPGETVRFKGWVRQVEGGRDLGLAEAVDEVQFRLVGPRREEVSEGSAVLTAHGGLHGAVELPATMNLGHAGVHLQAMGSPLPERGGQYRAGLQVQEYRRPEYEVQVEVDSGPHLMGDRVRATAQASYYGGGALPDAEVRWRVRASNATYRPPGWDGWTFGGAALFRWGTRLAPSERRLEGTADARGEHALEIDLVEAELPFAHRLQVESEVADEGRQLGSGSTTLIVHPATVYAALRADRAWIAAGRAVGVDVAVVDLDGAFASGHPVRVIAEKLAWRAGAPGRTGSWEVTGETDVCERASAPAEPFSCTFTPEEAGTVRLVAEARDRAGRPSRTERHLWVAGGAALPPQGGRTDPANALVSADRDAYEPGQVAEVLIQTPFHPAQATLTVARGGILRTESFRMEGPSHTVRIPIEETYVPGTDVNVHLVGMGPGVRHASGRTTLEVPPDMHALRVRIAPRDSVLEPGGQTAIEIEVVDPHGSPVAGAEVAVWVVDEAVLAAGRYRMPSPLGAFHSDRHAWVQSHLLHSSVLPAYVSAGPGTVSGIIRRRDDGAPLAAVSVRVPSLGLETLTDDRGAFTLEGVPGGEHRLRIEGPGAAGTPAEVVVDVPAEGVHLGTYFMPVRAVGGIMRARDQPADLPPPPAAERSVPPAAIAPPPPPGEDGITVRADFTPLALFEPALMTDSRGRVRVFTTLPGTITRYRIMAAAAHGTARFGTGESVLTARRDLTVRALPPRFLNFGDRAELPVLVQNLTDHALDVDVALRATSLRLEEGAGRRVSVPAGDRVEVRFPATAVETGTAHMQAVIASGARTDATAVQIPIYTPATAEAFATYGEIDSDRAVALPVRMPSGIIDQFGGIEATVSSTALQALTDAILFLKNHPFEGTEQVASRILAVASIGDVLEVFEAAELPPAEEIEAAMTRDLRLLASTQRRDGGWSLWGTGDDAHPYASIHAANALERARRRGYDVDDRAIERAGGFLRDIEEYVENYGPAARRSLIAYALYVRQRLGDEEAGDLAAQEAADPDRLPLAAAGWLLHVLAEAGGHSTVVDDLTRAIRNRAEETAATATFTTRTSDREQLLMHSDRCTHAVVLEALIAADPGSDLIPKAARGLLAHRVRGRWSTTLENAWALVALERYFTTYEETEPDFRFRGWLGDRFAGSHEFVGRTAARFHLEIPMSELARSGDDAHLLLEREGEGRMYYRAAIRYAPADLELAAEERGFVVERSYEGIDDADDVRRTEDGTWHIRAGARVRVRVNMTAPARRHHVALIDPLPAGLEPLNPALAGTGFTDDPEGDAANRRGSWWGRWFVHQNLRDDRAEAFAALLPAGVYEYVYQAQASTPGRYIVPPPRAEELYHPETFGRGGTARVVIE